jgi:plastocyanin
MKKSTLAVVIVLIIAVGAGALAYMGMKDKDDSNSSNSTTTSDSQTSDTDTSQNTNQTQPSEDMASTDEVEIENFAFGPSSITVKKGTKVTWTNKDSVQHNIVPDDGDSDAFKGSELLSRDESYSFTFNTPGTYKYHCAPHPQMTASITVTD